MVHSAVVGGEDGYRGTVIADCCCEVVWTTEDKIMIPLMNYCVHLINFLCLCNKPETKTQIMYLLKKH